MFLRLFGLSLVACSALLSIAAAFSFSPSTPTQCDSLSVSWSGGTAPFFLHVIPVFGTPRNVSIPPSAFNNGQGSFTLPQLPLPTGQDLLLTMSDSTGFGTGGSTNILKVGPSKGGQCDTKDPGVDFTFQLSPNLVQCRPYVISGYPNAVQPVSIMGIIPGGNSFVLRPPMGSGEFSWVANVEQGTSVIFVMVDGQGRQGGASTVRLAGNSDDRSCLNGLSPSSTPAAPTTSQTSTSGSSSTLSTNPSASGTAPPASTSSSTSSGGTSVGAIVGTVIGALLFIAVAVTLALFFLKRRKENANSAKRYSHPLGGTDLRHESFGGSHNPHPYSISSPPHTGYGVPPNPYTPNSYAPQPYTHGYQPSAYSATTTNHSIHNPSLSGGQLGGSMLPYDSNPFLDTHAPSNQYPPPAHYQHHSAYELPSASAYALPNPHSFDPLHDTADRNQPLPPPPPVEDPFAGSENETTTSAQQRKAAMAGIPAYNTPTRFVVHTDADDLLPPPNAEGVVELPPQYTERRGFTVTNPSPSPTPSSDRYVLPQPPTRPLPPS